MVEEAILTIGHATDPGLVRIENQDALEYRVPADARVLRQRGAALVVCDGMGGQRDGGAASQLAVSAFIRTYYEAPLDGCDHLLRRAAQAANAELFQANRSRRGLARMGTTLVAAAILGPRLWVINVGDSRAYLWRDGTLDQLSQDHVPAGRHGSDRRIELALGIESRLSPALFGPIAFEGSSRLLLCTDGLTTAVSEQVIAATLGSYPAPQAARRLVEQAKTAGARDNVSVLIAVLAEPVAPPTARSGRGRASRRMLAGFQVSDLNPWRILVSGRYRTRYGAVTLALWLFLALCVGLLFGWLVPLGR
jgi:protein phosphatase